MVQDRSSLSIIRPPIYVLPLSARFGHKDNVPTLVRHRTEIMRMEPQQACLMVFLSHPVSVAVMLWMQEEEHKLSAVCQHQPQ